MPSISSARPGVPVDVHPDSGAAAHHLQRLIDAAADGTLQPPHTLDCGDGRL